MKHLLIAACLGALTVTAAGTAVAQEPAKKAAAKKAPAKKKASKKGATAAAPVPPKGEKWSCELGNSLYVDGNMLRDEVLTLNWQGKEYKLPRQTTVTGADRYYDSHSGLDLVVIPSKAMLFDRKEGHRLADECQTVAMQGGSAAPTQAGALRAPVATPLLVAPAQQPAQPQDAAQQQNAQPHQ